MAFLTVNFFSHALNIHTAVNVIVPQAGIWPEPLPRRTWPTLYLLHGLSDDHTIWQRRTAIERYVEGQPLAVVMPAVNRSFYQDTLYGPAYWSYVSEELPERMRTWFPLSADRADNFVAGLSMGGYGALRVGLTHPDRYAAIASLSGATAYGHKRMNDPIVRDEMRAIYGRLSGIKGGPTDLFTLAEHLAEKIAAAGVAQPRIYQACGTADFLYKDNTAFHRHLTKLGIAHTWVTGPAAHEWSYWDEQIEQVVSWITAS